MKTAARILGAILAALAMWSALLVGFVACCIINATEPRADT